MANSKTLQLAIAEVQKATEFDQQEKYEEALKHYITGIEYFSHAKKYEVKGEKAIKSIDAKCNTYLERATLLKTHIDEKKNNERKPIAEIAGGNDSKKPGSSSSKDSKKDTEQDKLDEMIGGAIVVEKPNVKLGLVV